MISNNAYYELFASYTVPDHNRVGYWVDLGANSKGKVIKTYNENLKKWVKVTDATSEDAVAPFIGNNGNWWIDNRDTGINASGHSPYIGDNSNWFVYSSEINEHIDTGLPSRGEAGPKGDKGDKGKDATINGVGSIKIEAGDNITITQSDDTLTIIGDVQKPDLSNYATKTEVTKLDNKLQDAVSSVFRAKGSVKTYNNLPVDKVSIGDVYNVLDTGANYVAISINPITWDKLSETVDLSKFFNKNEIDSLLSTKVDKQEGKQLTTEDFTTVLKRKLEGLSNYNDTEIRNAIDSLESAFNTLVEGNATVAIDTFNEIVAFLKNVENSQDLDSIIAGINTTISKVEAKIPDTNNFLSKDGGTMNNTNLVGNLNAELLNGYSNDKFVNIHNLINGTATDATTVGLNTINQDYLWTNTPYSDIATLMDISYSPDWRSLFFISPSTKRIHTRFKYNGDLWSNWKEIAFTDGSVANADMLDGLHSDSFAIIGTYSSSNDSNYNIQSGIYRVFEQFEGFPGVYARGHSLIHSNWDNNAAAQLLLGGVYDDNIYYRTKVDNQWKDWRTIMFDGDTAASANKLSTTRYLWGQPFDGSRDVNGVMHFIKLGNLITVGDEHWANKTVLSTGYDTTNGDWTKLGVAGVASNSAGIILTHHGRVGIGTFTPVSELHVVGKPIFNHNGQHGDGGLMIIRNNASITGWDRAIFAHYPNLEVGAHANFHIGKADSEKNGGYISYYHAGDSSGNNCMTIGLYATDDILNVTANRRVGINTTTPRNTLDVNGSSVIDGFVYLKGVNRRIYFYNSEGEGLLIDNNGINWHYVNDSFAFNIMSFSSNKRVGIGTTNPQEALDVNGNIRVTGYARLTGDVFINSGTSSDNNNAAGKLFFCGSNNTDHGVYLSATKCDTYGRKRFGIFTTNAASETPNWIEAFSITPGGYVGIGTSLPVSELDVRGTFNLTGALNLNDDNQINGKVNGIAINYNCGKLVNTHIFNGTSSSIASFIGENRRMGLKTTTPEATLDVNGDSIFRNHVFVKKYHHIYMSTGEEGVYYTDDGLFWHNANNEYVRHLIKFDSAGAVNMHGPVNVNYDGITILNLNRYEAVFNGTVTSLNCNFTGTWNSRERFRLIRDGEYSTWLQAGTDTTKEGGRLCMSGHSATLLSEFNVYASKSTFSGNIIANGDVTAYSDIRLKNKIESVSNVLDTINNLDVFRYTWKDREDKSIHIGVSAQQVQTIYPEFVLTSSSEDGTDYLTVNYAALATCIAIQGIKELAKKGDERDKRIAALEEEVISLKEQLRYGNK